MDSVWRFAELLTEGVHRVRLHEAKTIAAIQDELGYALERKGGASIEHWRKGHLPPTLAEVETLCRQLVPRGRLDREWLEGFLRSADHPAPGLLVEELFEAERAIDAESTRIATPTPDPSHVRAHHTSGPTKTQPVDRVQSHDDRIASVLPAGTVTFFVTQVEDLIRSMQRLGVDYPEVLTIHNRLIRAAIDQAGGVVVDQQQGGFFAAFSTATKALEAAITAQRFLAMHPWPQGRLIRAAMGLHTGDAMIFEERYIGIDASRASQICAAGHGGQILISPTVQPLVQHALPTGCYLQDLGAHRLQELEEPVPLFQVTVPDLAKEFPPPRAMNVRPHTLPSEVTDFVGRTEELGAVKKLLHQSRLLTLVGPGGTGKTRLAIRAGAEVLPEFVDGVFFVSLASVHEAHLLASTIAENVGVINVEGRSRADALKDYLKAKNLLLVLDNFEQISDAASQVSDLLAAAPGLKVLVTSRTLLRLSGEQVFQVPPLAEPHADDVVHMERLAKIDSINLFVRRVRAVNPDFVLTAQNAPAVIGIVKRLEGLPLAIELAAIQSRMFPPDILEKRLNTRLKILRGGAKDLPARHQTLRNTIAWSYELLAPAEQVLFRRLGIFVGGFTLEAAEAISDGDSALDIVDSVFSLFDKSLLQRRVQLGEIRFFMLETIREFALEELEAAGEVKQLAHWHASYYLTVAERAESFLKGHGQEALVDYLSADHDNFRVALHRCLTSGDIETGLHLGGALWRFWHAAGHLREGRNWIGQVLARAEGSPSARAKALAGLAGLAYWQADYEEALARYQDALEIYRNLGDRQYEADTLLSMSTTLTWSGDTETGTSLAESALNIFEELHIRDKVGMALMAKGFACWIRGDLKQARPLWEESLAIAREVGDHVEAATKRLALASIRFQQGEHEEALESALDALEELVSLKHVSFTIMALDWVAAIAAHGDPQSSSRLAGAAAALRASLGGGMRPESSGLSSARDTASRYLTAEIVDELWVEGQEMGFEQAIEYARTVASALLNDHPLRNWTQLYVDERVG